MIKKGKLKIIGQTIGCGDWNVAGRYNKKTKIGSGGWTNACGSSGSWSMDACQ